MTAGVKKRSFWTWGFTTDEPSEAERQNVARTLSKRAGRDVKVPVIPTLADIELRKSRIRIPSQLSEWVSDDKHERVVHTYGGHTLELLQAMRGQFDFPPDAVAHPADEEQLERTLTWCDAHGYAVIPYGGGTTVVRGVSVPTYVDGAVTIDLDGLKRVLEVDEISRAARIQAGIFGPDLEDALRPQGFTLRHFPQSFPWSTLGGWIATRSGGHYATNHTHIDDFVESMRLLTPSGWWQSRRLPGSGAGPSPDRLVLGSEGTLGIITEAWMRIQQRPRFRATAGVIFPDWESGYNAARHIAQAKLWPANLRLLDCLEAQRGAGLDGEHSLLIIGFESGEVPQHALIGQAVEIARDSQGVIRDEDIRISDSHAKSTVRSASVGAWRDAFIGVNAGLTNGMGLLADTFETAVTWDRWPHFDRQVRTRVGTVLREVLGQGATLSCRFTHVYPDGPAPYYTFSGMAELGAELEQWQAIKTAANDAILSGGGTITHHHSVGRMHASGWQQQSPSLFQNALRAAKQELDPNGILNPGVLFEPR